MTVVFLIGAIATANSLMQLRVNRQVDCETPIASAIRNLSAIDWKLGEPIT